MDIHKPKPVQNWREFLTEIGIIVVGVLIALGAEQTVEAAHWREKVEIGRGEIRAEMSKNAAYYAFRVVAGPCVVRRLTALADITEDVATRRHVAPVRFAGLHLGDLIGDHAWQAERAEQTLTHLPRAELSELARFYAQQEDIKHWVDQEEDAWATLRMLEGDPNRLGAADASTLRAALQQARNLNFLIALNSQVEIDQARKLGADIPQARAEDLNRSCAPLDRTLNPSPMGNP